MKGLVLIGMVAMLLVSGCYTGKVVESKIEEVPVSGAPYDYQELSSTTLRFPMMVVRNESLSKISDVVLEKIVKEVRTFNGKPYETFEPQLELISESNKTVDWVFKGKGYIDNVNFDEYEIYLYYDKNAGRAEFDQRNFGWYGVPTKYKVLAEEIVRKERGLDKESFPLGYLRWNPDVHGLIEISFGKKLFAVDLESGEVMEG